MSRVAVRPSVIICAYTLERLQDTRAAVDSVLAQTLPPQEVILSVDNNQELFERFKRELPASVRLLMNDRIPGLSETRNVGLREASGDIIAFMDDDAEAERDWLEHLVSPFQDPRVMATGGQALPVWPGGSPPLWFPEEYDFIIGCTAHNRLMVHGNGEVRNVTGCCMAFRREVFETLGGWKTELGRGQTKTGGEEAELCLRIKSRWPQGLILYEEDAIVHHKVSPHRATLKYVLPYAFHEGIVRAMLRQHASQFMQNPLAGEQLFLRRLLLNALPRRVKNFYQPGALAQALVIITNTLLIGAGYLVGRWQYR